MCTHEPSKQLYSREDEDLCPWSLRHLHTPPSIVNHAGPFFPWSRFTVFRAGLQKMQPLQWPARLWMSKNFFRPSWTLNSHRRLKNVICAIEWEPGVQSDTPGSASSHVHISHEQAARVQAAFGFFDEDGDGVLTAAELAAAGRAVDLHTVAQYAAAVAPDLGALRLVDLEGTASPVVPLVQKQLASHHDGPGSRHWVLLSLMEAESLRGALHISQESMQGILCLDSASPPPTIALHVHGHLLDAINIGATTSTDAYNHRVVHECFSFLSGETEFTRGGQHLLLRCLQRNEPRARQTFFAEVRACRRRQQSPWERTSLAAVLDAPDEFTLFEMRALLAACERRVHGRSMSMRQAFHAFNSSRTGCLSASELFSGLLWLNMQVEVVQIRQLMRTFGAQEDGLLSCDDFIAAFAGGGTLDEQSGPEAPPLVPPSDDILIPLKRIPELHNDSAGQNLTPTPPLSRSELCDFVVTMQPCKEFKLVVKNQCSTRDGRCVLSIWQPNPSCLEAGAARMLVPIGHYAIIGLSPPSGENGYELLELCDAYGSSFHGDASWRLLAALEQLMPLPCRYRAIWSAQGPDPFTVWMPVPPSQDFIALGAVASAATSSQPPPLDAARCVPRTWVQDSSTPAQSIWDDPDVSIWTGSHGLLLGAKGHQPPSRMHQLKRGFLKG